MKKGSDLDNIDKEIQKTIKKQGRLLDIYVEGLITIEEYNGKNTALKNQLVLLNGKKNRLESELSTNGQNTIKDYNGLYEYIKLDSLAVNKLIKKITVYNHGKIRVEYDFTLLSNKAWRNNI